MFQGFGSGHANIRSRDKINNILENSLIFDQNTPCAYIALATLRKPAVLAPLT